MSDIFLLHGFDDVFIHSLIYDDRSSSSYPGEFGYLVSIRNNLFPDEAFSGQRSAVS